MSYAASMAALLAIAGWFLYVRLNAELLSSTDAALRSEASTVAAGIGQQGPNFADQSPGSGGGIVTFAQVLSPEGHVIESGESIGGSALLPATILRSTTRPTFLERTVPGVEGSARIFVLPVEEEGSRFDIVVAASLNDRREVVSRFLLLLAIGGAATLSVASALGWFLAGAALRPIERMRREADAISMSDGSRRLSKAGTRDEVARLGSTLNTMLDRLQSSFESERRFVDDASHELRTPLSILRAEFELATSRARSRAELEAAIRSALEEVDRLVSLADDLLVYSRAEAGRVPVPRVPVRIDDLVRDAAARHAGRARAAGVTLDVQSTPLTVSIDDVRIRQAIDNLLVNALRHTPPGGHVRVVAAREPGGVALSVEDSGTGFPPDVLDRAFEPFTRGSRDRAEGAPGAGLGLAIVRAVALAHGGRAVAENRAERGARVTLFISAAAADDSPPGSHPGLIPVSRPISDARREDIEGR